MVRNGVSIIRSVQTSNATWSSSNIQPAELNICETWKSIIFFLSYSFWESTAELVNLDSFLNKQLRHDNPIKITDACSYLITKSLCFRCNSCCSSRDKESSGYRSGMWHTRTSSKRRSLASSSPRFSPESPKCARSSSGRTARLSTNGESLRLLPTFSQI